MRTLEVTLTVWPDGTATVALPPEVAPGVHRAVIVIEEPIVSTNNLIRFPFHLHAFEWKGLPANWTFRREDIYDDDDR